MHIKDIDLNLLRLFEAVHRLGSVSRAAEALDLSQPAASQALTRLRLLLGDALFVRAPGGVRPTPRAERLSRAVHGAISMLETALNEGEDFDAARSPLRLRLYLSDIGEARFLPPLMVALRTHSETLRILQQLQLLDRLRLTSSNFLALPEIVKRTDLAAVMPLNIALEFASHGDHAVLQPRLPQGHFNVALHWSRRFEADPAHRWLRQLIVTLFKAD